LAVGISVAVTLVLIVVFSRTLLAKIVQAAVDGVGKSIDTKMQLERERMQEQRQADQQLVDEKRKAIENSNITTKDSIKELVEALSKEVEKSQQKLEHSEKERIATFNTLKTSLEEYRSVGEGLKESTDDLRNILSNNQLRGKYGEEVAENLLKSVGFVRGQHYSLNESQDTTNTRPDVTLLLPDGQKVNIDVKFPFQSLVRFQEVDDKESKQKHFAQFKLDVKQKIKEVTTRDYVSPEEGTVDFVILFVPNEMIFSFIYEELNEVWNDALHRKVILAGPFSFTAILRMVYQSYSTFSYQENVREIIKLIKTFEDEWVKFSDELDKLGTRIDSTDAQFRKVAVTRTKKLSAVVEKIREGEKDTLVASESVAALPINTGVEPRVQSPE